MPPLFFKASRWWLRPLLALPESAQASLVLWRLGRLCAVLPERSPCDLWEGQGSLLLYTIDPAAFALLPRIAALTRQFPKAKLLVHDQQAAWWQALLPGTQVTALPPLLLWNRSLRERIAQELTATRSDWCWNLREDDHPLSRALTRFLGSSWRIGKGGAPWANLSIEPAPDTAALAGARIDTLCRTFGWDVPLTSPVRPGSETVLHLPALPAKKLAAWEELARELQTRHQATIFRSGPTGLASGLPSRELPAPSTLLALAPRLAAWVGPWDTDAGALAACGVPVLAVGKKPASGVSGHATHLPRQGQFKTWWEAMKKAPPQRDEA